MSVRFLPRGAKVADAAFPNSSFPAALDAAGFEAFCGYLSSPTANGKNWTQQRLDWFADMGCGMFCEQYETIVLTGYSAANLQLGRQCQDMADSFGVPDTVPMWFAVDTSPFGHFPEIAASFKAYKDTNRRPLGGYVGSQCGEFLMDEGLIDYLHVPSALSWSATNASLDGETVFAYNNGKNRWYLSPRAHMLQHNSIDFAGSRIDPSDVLRDTPFWFPADQPPVDPPTQGDIHMAGQWLGAVDINEGGFGVLVFGSDGQYYKYSNHPGSVFYAFPHGHIGAAEYNALPEYNPVADAYWVADRMKERGVGGGGAGPKAVRITSVPGDAAVVY